MKTEVEFKETGQELLIRLSQSNTSNDTDSAIIQNILRKVGFPQAVVTTGIVYLDGRGTIENHPTSIHSIAKTLIKGLKITI